MKLIFPLRDIERSAKMCDSLFHCDCSEGTLADVHSFSVIHCLHFSPCLMSELTLQNNRTSVLFFISLFFFCCFFLMVVSLEMKTAPHFFV